MIHKFLLYLIKFQRSILFTPNNIFIKITVNYLLIQYFSNKVLFM